MPKKKQSTEAAVREIRRRTRRLTLAAIGDVEEAIHALLAPLRGRPSTGGFD